MEDYTPINIAIANERGHYAGALYGILKQKYAAGYLERRDGKLWIPSLPFTQIIEEYPVFPDKKTLWIAAEKLRKADWIETETTGAFSRGGVAQSRDYGTWWSIFQQPGQSMMLVDTREAQQHGIHFALILAYWRVMPEVNGFRTLSPAVMADVLPTKERTIAEQLKQMVELGLLERSEDNGKLYRLPVVVARSWPEAETDVVLSGGMAGLAVL